MKFNTALCLVTAGVALWFSRSDDPGTGKARAVAIGAAFTTLAVGGLTLSQDLFGWSIGLDELIVSDWITAPADDPGRMSPATSLCFVLTGAAFLFLHAGRIRLAQGLAIATICFGFFAIVGYLYDFEQLYTLFAFSSMATHTAIAFVLLGLGILSLRSSTGIVALLAGDSPGSIVVRRIWLPVIVAMIVVGGGVEWSERHHLIDDHLDSMVLVVFNVLLASTLIGFSARSLNRSHVRLLHINRLYAVLSKANQSIVHIRVRDQLFDTICRALVETGGFRTAWIGLVEEETGRMIPTASVGLPHEAVARAPATQTEAGSQDVAERVIQERKPVVLNHVAQSSEAASAPDAAVHSESIASAAFPLEVYGRVIGALAVYSSKENYFKDREVDLLTEVASDVSYALSQMESDALRAAAERDSAYLAAIVASSDDAIISKDLSGIVTSWNAGAERIFGYSASEIVGRPITLLFPEDKQEREEQYILGQIQQGKRIENLETVRVHKDGHLLEVSLTISPIKDAAGDIIGVSKIARDITEQKRLEQAQRATRKAAEEASRMKSVILDNMSHEIRTPLTAIIGFAQVLANQLNGQQRGFAETIINGGERLLETLGSILTLADLEANQTSTNLHPLAIADEVRDIVSLFERKAATRGLYLSLEIAPQAVHTRALLNRGGLTSILQNLIGNAIKFTHEGSVHVSVTVEKHEFPDAPPEWVLIQVSDSGIGIAPSFLPKLFLPFTQESSGTARSYEGSGLGLSIAAQMAERMGGAISVESAKEGGSRFTVRLPLLPDTASDG